jgi:hypothetical protein
MGETVSPEEARAVPYRGSPTQTGQGGRFRTTMKAIEKWFMDLPPTRVAMEAGVHSIWISEHLQESGHEVIVANVRELQCASAIFNNLNRLAADLVSKHEFPAPSSRSQVHIARLARAGAACGRAWMR